MLRLLLIGLWASAASLGGAYGGLYWRNSQNNASKEAHAEKLDVRKMKPVTVPVIENGAVKGYVSAEFSIVGPEKDPHAHELDPEGFFLDEAFRLIYSETKIDFTNIEKSDLNQLTSRLTERVNQRLGKTAIKETLVKNFTFIAQEDMPR